MKRNMFLLVAIFLLVFGQIATSHAVKIADQAILFGEDDAYSISHVTPMPKGLLLCGTHLVSDAPLVTYGFISYLNDGGIKEWTYELSTPGDLNDFRVCGIYQNDSILVRYAPYWDGQRQQYFVINSDGQPVDLLYSQQLDVTDMMSRVSLLEDGSYIAFGPGDDEDMQWWWLEDTSYVPQISRLDSDFSIEWSRSYKQLADSSLSLISETQAGMLLLASPVTYEAMRITPSLVMLDHDGQLLWQTSSSLDADYHFLSGVPYGLHGDILAIGEYSDGNSRFIAHLGADGVPISFYTYDDSAIQIDRIDEIIAFQDGWIMDATARDSNDNLLLWVNPDGTIRSVIRLPAEDGIFDTLTLASNGHGSYAFGHVRSSADAELSSPSYFLKIDEALFDKYGDMHQGEQADDNSIDSDDISLAAEVEEDAADTLNGQFTAVLGEESADAGAAVTSNLFHFTLQGETGALPTAFNFFEDHGWIVGEETPLPASLAPESLLTVPLRFEGEGVDASLQAILFNPTGTDIDLRACSVVGLYLNEDAGSADFLLGGELALGHASAQDIIDLYGEPDMREDDDGDVLLSWQTDQSGVLRLRLSGDVLDTITMENFVAETNSPLPGEEVLTTSLDIDGDAYTMPFPLQALLENGWVVTETEDLPVEKYPQPRKRLTITRGDLTGEIHIAATHADGQLPLEAHSVIGVVDHVDSTLSVSLSNGIGLGSTLSDLWAMPDGEYALTLREDGYDNFDFLAYTGTEDLSTLASIHAVFVVNKSTQEIGSLFYQVY